MTRLNQNQKDIFFISSNDYPVSQRPGIDLKKISPRYPFVVIVEMKLEARSMGVIEPEGGQ